MTPQRSDLQLGPFPDTGDAIPAGADRTDCHIGVTRIAGDGTREDRIATNPTINPCRESKAVCKGAVR